MNFAGLLVGAVAQFGIVLALTRLISQEEAGVFFIGLATFRIAAAFFGLGLNVTAVRYIALSLGRDDRVSAGAVGRTVLALSVLGGAVGAAVLVAASGLISDVFGSRGISQVIAIMAIGLPFSTFTQTARRSRPREPAHNKRRVSRPDRGYWFPLCRDDSCRDVLEVCGGRDRRLHRRWCGQLRRRGFPHASHMDWSRSSARSRTHGPYAVHGLSMGNGRHRCCLSMGRRSALGSMDNTRYSRGVCRSYSNGLVRLQSSVLPMAGIPTDDCRADPKAGLPSVTRAIQSGRPTVRRRRFHAACLDSRPRRPGVRNIIRR